MLCDSVSLFQIISMRGWKSLEWFCGVYSIVQRHKDSQNPKRLAQTFFLHLFIAMLCFADQGVTIFLFPFGSSITYLMQALSHSSPFPAMILALEFLS